MKKKDVTTRIRYQSDVSIDVVLPNGTSWQGHGDLFHRIDYFKDGSRADWYGVELTRDQYKETKRHVKDKVTI